jgi:hypothetical protein
MDNRRYLQIAALLIAAALVLFLLPHKSVPAPASVTDFESCRSAGGEIIDGEPVVCKYGGQTYEEAVPNNPEVILDQPHYGDLVTSPLTIKGQARGNWFFEANLPAILKDENGRVLAQVGLQAKGNWMTRDFVPFEGIMTFDPGTANYGVLIISKDNPSGLPEFDSSVAVPLRFR